jgi:hypothetical protein
MFRAIPISLAVAGFVIQDRRDFKTGNPVISDPMPGTLNGGHDVRITQTDRSGDSSRNAVGFTLAHDKKAR